MSFYRQRQFATRSELHLSVRQRTLKPILCTANYRFQHICTDVNGIGRRKQQKLAYRILTFYMLNFILILNLLSGHSNITIC